MPGGSCLLNKEWLDGVYKDWVMEDKDNRKAKCAACNSCFDIGNMGIKAVESHGKGKKHQKNLKIFLQYKKGKTGMENYFSTSSPSKSMPSSKSSNTSTSHSEGYTEEHFSKEEVLKSEIW